MRDLISTKRLAALLEHAGGSRTAAAHMTLALLEKPAEYLGVHGGAARDLLPTYRARQHHVQRTGLRTEGLDEFVEVLVSEGSSQVYLASVPGEAWTTIALLSSDLESVIACVAVEAGRP